MGPEGGHWLRPRALLEGEGADGGWGGPQGWGVPGTASWDGVTSLGAVLALPVGHHPGQHPEWGAHWAPVPPGACRVAPAAPRLPGQPWHLRPGQGSGGPPRSPWPPSHSLCACVTLGAPSVGTGLGAARHKGQGGAGSVPEPLPVCPLSGVACGAGEAGSPGPRHSGCPQPGLWPWACFREPPLSPTQAVACSPPRGGAGGAGVKIDVSPGPPRQGFVRRLFFKLNFL